MLRITGNEKAVLGGLVSALVTVVAQVQQSGQLTLKEFGTALVAYLFTHVTVWTATNSTKTDLTVGAVPAPSLPVDTPPSV